MKPRFVLDGMLGSLVRWLRICGYDAEYQNDAPDGELIRRAREDDRILLTKDRLLAGEAKREGATAFYVEGETTVEKLSSVSGRFRLSLIPVESRCPNCNSPLRPAEKIEVRERVPSKTHDAFEEFWLCDHCGSVFWRGSHWRNIVETLEEASNRT